MTKAGRLQGSARAHAQKKGQSGNPGGRAKGQRNLKTDLAARPLHSFLAFRHDDQVDSITQYLTWAQTRPKTSFEAHFDHGGGMPSAQDTAYRMMMFGRRQM